MADVDATILPLEGFPLAIFVVSLVCLGISTITIALRTYVRINDNAFGWDDKLIVLGLMVYIVDVALACHGARVGLGSYNSRLNSYFLVQGTKYLMLWMMLYVVGLAVIKSSICVTLLRIASAHKVYRLFVLSLLGLTIATFLVTLIGILLLCRPVAANWDTSLVTEGKGTCSGMGTMIALSYTSTACTIVTDLACAVFPGVMLYRTQMPLGRKIQVGLLLSFASVASISTMIRAPYIEHYRTPTDNLLYYTGFIVLLSNIETAIGCVASSIPTVGRFFMRNSAVKKSTSDADGPKDLVTFGSAPISARNNTKGRTFRNPTDTGTTFATVHAHGDGDWSRLHDGDSDHNPDLDNQNGIRTDYTYQVELSKSPKHNQSESVRELAHDGSSC
ncbi:hypothetical protein BCIN_02g07920 [Botrytis cinerea B05.10]|uniref:Rhodopsin domain-containing protein n=3 Tax=Botryotinia fuckeliana TaxID=40559 RepID=A0A384JAK0_BOTFB|nr:hypothetical protein BCIN_02g07920 [Botrytis cinerea B05.10]ATZ47520.1 hypothetical protein BCIN_02g07920 [Botrytis cinerea B05.10]EMR82227.1 putative integral membrane protein [Botrytis cinerea BcDW1]CCD43290.1 hypothetical protein BofuT4P78000003001 [Botrytis cinerea T4]